jgi:hypothetical protein
MSPDRAVAVLTMMGISPAPPRPDVDCFPAGNCPRCRQKKKLPASSKIKTAIHNPWRRFLLDAGRESAVGDLSVCVGCGAGSDIFNSVLLFFRQSYKLCSATKYQAEYKQGQLANNGDNIMNHEIQNTLLPTALQSSQNYFWRVKLLALYLHSFVSH